ncbi:hypothetical protein B6325_21370 [Salmonella enterica subsp. enterica serovar Saintpaul]|nr:hypothetical protein [Salmonella enterica]EBD7887078.1 hypothetical protein [Salmonella enterica]ECV2562587.1 hypothetical protein [Salmonella enterica subsp. enterica serovar Saintpaul]EHW0758889.1 hypothetical protein [Escherichia coli O157]EIA6554907.1 hypothetical protein [Escherichia coli]
MQPDNDFYTHLGSLSKGASRQEIYKEYKTSENDNFCFNMNGLLRAGHPLQTLQAKFDAMKSIFRAQNLEQIVLFRMTSSCEFTPGGAEVALGMPFRYPAFLSTSRNVDVLRSFNPSQGIPTVLIITCPAGMRMALMEGNNSHSGEAEVLLEAYAEYKITSAQKVSSDAEIKKYILPSNLSKTPVIYVLEMEMTGNAVTPSHAQIDQSEMFNFKPL